MHLVERTCLLVRVVEGHTRLQVGEELHELLADMHSLETSQVPSADHDSVSNGAREQSARGANFAAVQAAAVLQDDKGEDEGKREADVVSGEAPSGAAPAELQGGDASPLWTGNSSHSSCASAPEPKDLGRQPSTDSSAPPSPFSPPSFNPMENRNEEESDQGCCKEMHGDVHVNDDIEDRSEEAGAGGSQQKWKAAYHSVMEELKVSQELRQINERIASLESIQGQGSDVQEESGWTQFDDSPGLDVTDTAHNDMFLQDLAKSNSKVEANLPDEMAKQHGDEVEEEEDDDSETEELKREIAFLQEQNVVSQPILQGTTVTSRRVELLRTGPPAPHDGQVSLFLVAEQGWLPLRPEWKPEHLIQPVCT